MQNRKCKAFRKPTFVMLSLIIFLTFISSGVKASNLLDEFSSIYHSNVIIEVGVILNKDNKPKESCYLKTIKGNKAEVEEVLKFFGICKEKKKLKPDQKRLMAFYRNRHGKLRSMDLIRKGVGPYSDQETYGPFVKMVKLLNSKMGKKRNSEENVVVLKSKSICRSLLKNRYFAERYRGDIVDGSFSVGGDAGAFREFVPLVEISCERKRS